MPPTANALSLDMVLDILKRRAWLAAVSLSVMLAPVVSVVMWLPNLYTASVVILVEGQQIPQDYVRSTVTMGLDHRLQILSQEILSRSRLGKLAEQFGLYQDLRAQQASEDAIASAMRQDIGIQIKGRGTRVGSDTVVFEVGYTNADPRKVVDVANTIASFYIDGNLKVREQQALGTSEFLRTELDQIQERLEVQEARVVEYKKNHMGELPEQLNANLSTMTVLQKQMEIISENLIRARERRTVLGQMAEMEAALASVDMLTPSSAGDARLGALKSKLAELRGRFFDTHPDIVRVKQQIAMLEAELNAHEKKSQSEAPDPAIAAPISSAQLEQATVEAEVKTLTADLAKVQREIVVYKQRIENIPQREQELLSLSRDYNSTRELYLSLLKRLDEAKLADSLEQRQKAERFRLLEPAIPPEAPAGPQRARLLMIGCIVSVAVTAALVLLREMLDSSIHHLDDLKVVTNAVILGTIPHILTATDRSRTRLRHLQGTATLVVLLAAAVGASYWLAVGNEHLVRLLVQPAADSQYR